MAEHKGWLRRVWDWIGHTGTAWWLIQLFVGPAVGMMTLIKGMAETIPMAYAITAAIVSAGGTIYFLNQIALFSRRWREGYAYGLAYIGPLLGYNTNQANAALQLGIVIVNVSDRPLRYSVKRLNVIVENTTLTNPTYVSMGGFINRNTQRQFSFPAFTKAQIEQFIGKSGLNASLSYEILYGHPDGPNVRKLEMDLSLTLNLTSHDKFGVRDVIQKESDTRV